ncbi:oxalate decarboxylase oxdD [Diplocarpon rosae]|nr:oxalate decarboxylase oxdD [Diplocarpon rosae]
MRLAPHAYRELHWHTANEWALIMKGSVRLSALNKKGETFTDDVGAGAMDDGPESNLSLMTVASLKTPLFLQVRCSCEIRRRCSPKILRLRFQPLITFPRTSYDGAIPLLCHSIGWFDGALYIFDGTPAPVNIREQTQTGPAGILPSNDSYT